MTVGVTFAFEPSTVLVDGQTNNMVFGQITLTERDALFGQISLGYASIWMGHVTNESFDDAINPLERHHAMQECRP